MTTTKTFGDPTLPATRPYRAHWRLRVNLDPEKLKAIV